jgi:hypothetical protein
MNLFKRSLGLVGATALLAITALPALAADTAQLRVLHASPDAPAVDIYIDDAIVEGWTNVPFGTISDYLDVPAGDYNFKVFATGTTEGPVIDADVSLAAGKAYTAAATGELASITPAVLEDGGMSASDEAMVRVVHFSADARAVDVAPDGADAVVSGLEFPNETDYLALDPGEYDLEVRIAGTMDVALQLDPVQLETGQAYSVFAIGSAAEQPLGGNALEVLIATDAMLMPDTAIADDVAAAAGTPIVMVASLLGLAAFIVMMVTLRPAGARR